MEINLKHVDPKTCFKNFKGIGSSKLNGLTAIQPILQISRTDRRFTNHYEVADSIDSSTNLASMDWEDFEKELKAMIQNQTAYTPAVSLILGLREVLRYFKEHGKENEKKYYHEKRDKKKCFFVMN